MQYLLKKNDYFYELVLYETTSDSPDTDTNPDRERDYALESSRRAKSVIKDLSLNNEWTHFLTLTIDKTKHNRHDYQTIKKKLTKAFNHYRNRKDPEFKYILKAELHKDQAIHFHGLLKMSKTEGLLDFNPKATQKQRLEMKKKHGTWNDKITVYDWIPFREKFGWTHLTPIYNRSEFIAYYMSKYISKNQDHIFHNYYFRSNGLNRSSVVAYGNTNEITIEDGMAPEFEGQFTTTYQLNEEQAAQLFKRLII